MNSINESIKFTVEIESNGQLPYLDLQIQRGNDGRLSFDIFRKRTHSNNYFKFDSYHPNQAKKAVAISLFDRAKIVCSQENIAKEEDRIKETLIKNGYNKKFLNKIIYQRQSN